MCTMGPLAACGTLQGAPVALPAPCRLPLRSPAASTGNVQNRWRARVPSTGLSRHNVLSHACTPRAHELLLRGPSQQTVASLCPKGSDHRLAISPVRETMARATRRVVGVLRSVFRLVAGLAVTCSRSSHALAFGRRGLIANLPWRWTGRRSNCCLRGVFGLSCRWRWVGRKRFQAPSTAQTSLAAARPLRAKKAAARGGSALALLRAPARALCLARYLW
jgi:hypothetical protein